MLLAPWEEFFLSTIKDLPIDKASVPSVDPDTKKKVFKYNADNFEFCSSALAIWSYTNLFVVNRWKRLYAMWR